MKDIYQSLKYFKNIYTNLNNTKTITNFKSNLTKISLIKPNLKTLPHNIVSFSDISNSQSGFIKRLVNILRVFEEVTGLDQVKHSRDQVNTLRNELDILFQRRMSLSPQIFKFNNLLKEIHQKMDKTYKGEDLYYQYLEEERKIYLEKRKISQEFKLIEEEERYKFTQLTLAMKTSDDLVQVQQERSRYLSIFYSIISGGLMFILGWFLNYKKYSDLKSLIEEKPEKQSEDELYKINSKLDSLQEYIKNKNSIEEEKPIEERTWKNLMDKPYVKYSVLGAAYIIAKFCGL